MVGQYGIKLALNLIQNHFGTRVTKVCECLLRKGTLTLREIAGFTELDPNPVKNAEKVKNCLLVLIQHNCVQPFSFKNQDGEEDPPKDIHYTVNFDNIIHRMRFPKFLAIVTERLDKECAELLEGLLQHGRLTLDQSILRALSNRIEGDIAVQDAIRENFGKLVNARYVERSPDAVSSPKLQGNPTTGRRGAKSAKFVEPVTVEEQAIIAAIPSERFLLITNSGTDVNSEANTLAKPPTGAVGEKRKIDTLGTDEETTAMINEREILWRANFEEFVRHLRHKACVSSVRSRYDDGAGTVLSAMLEATKKAEQKVKVESSVPLSTDALFEEVIKNEEGRTMTIEHVEGILTQLGCDQSQIGKEDSCSVDLRNIIEIAQNEEVESLVLKRYGKDAYKIFRLLSKEDKLMETDKISDTAFVEKADARRLLYNLWKDDYLHMEKVGSQASAYSQYFLWKVNKRLVRENAFDEMCHAALNLRLRLAHELEQEREILQLPRDKRVGAQGKRHERIRKVNILMESSLMMIDDALLLFHEF